MTADLSAFILARIDGDEAAAKAASPGPWHVDAESATVLAVDDIEVCDGFALSGPQLRATTEHIARHDPARVLAQCTALREVVDLHGELYWFSGARGSEATGKCRMCAENEESDYDGAPLVDYPCPTLRALAGIWRDHDDYRPEEWA